MKCARSLVNSIHNPYRSIPKRFKSDAPKPQVTPPENDGNSALAERFQQILDQKLSTSIGTPSVVKTDPSLKKTYETYNAEQEESFKRASAFIKSEPLLSHNKHAKDIYNSKPWDGTESVHDANLRMILDSKPPPMTGRKSDRIFTPPVSKQEKLVRAKEGSLDYRLRSKEDYEKSESEQFREMYKERLLGPSMLISNTPSMAIDLANNLASSKINASLNQKTGQFDSPEMAHVRGKPLSREHLKNSRDTNYFMNQILNKQEVLPPWIETQQNIDGSVKRLRNDLDELWFKWIINRSSVSSQISSSTRSTVLSLYDTNIRFTKFDASNLIPSDRAYLEERIKLLNSSIRAYNLQCPSSSIHKFKLLVDQEISDSFTRTINSFPVTFDAWIEKKKQSQERAKLIERSGGGGLLGIWGDNSRGGSGVAGSNNHYQRPDSELGLWKAVKSVFKGN